MLRLGAPELLILLVIVILLFGVGRIAKISGELGSAIRNFREAVQDKDEKKTDETNLPQNRNQ